MKPPAGSPKPIASSRPHHQELTDQPSARAQLLATIGSSEFHLGHLDSAEKLLREALRIRIETDGGNSPVVAGILNDLGPARKHQDHLDDTERLLRESIAIREKSLGHTTAPPPAASST